jgi:hypothetical protein
MGFCYDARGAGIRAPNGEKTMPDGPVVEEMRRIKEAHAARYNYDIRAMATALRGSDDAMAGEYRPWSKVPAPKRPLMV